MTSADLTDRELLERAAKAAGYREFLEGNFQAYGKYNVGPDDRGQWIDWNPLTDDGDALRLAVKLRLLVSICPHHTEVRWYDEALSETHSVEQWDNGMQPDEFTRRAIVRAAAAIGRSQA